MLCHELKKGDVHTIRMMGQDVVVFRAMDGTPAVVDPFCAHLGAHLGEGTQSELIIHFVDPRRGYGCWK